MMIGVRVLLATLALARVSSLGSSCPFPPLSAERLRVRTQAGGLTLSPVVTDITPSKTLEVHGLTQAMRARGEEVVSLAVGEPDFDPPQPILDATAQAAKNGDTRYTAMAGNN
jgi:hypothetical protein